MSNVISLSDKLKDGTKWSAEQMLADALMDVSSGDHPEKKAMILWLDDTDGYRIGFSQCGMTMPECVLLCELAKDRFKQEFFDDA